jgi:hypothetical protein
VVTVISQEWLMLGLYVLAALAVIGVVDWLDRLGGGDDD